MTTRHVAITCRDCGSEFEGLPTTRWCEDCRYKPANRRGARKPKWVTNPAIDALISSRYDSRVKGRVNEIAAAVHWPTWAVRRRAMQLGLSLQKPQRWSSSDLAFLEQHVGTRTPAWIAKRLGRTLTAVHSKCKAMKISRVLEHEGYTLRGIAECFGVDSHVVARWVREGRLRAKKVSAHPRDPWVFDEADVVRFIASNPSAFSLRHVDQLWFIDLFVSRLGARSEAGPRSTHTAIERRLDAN